MKSILLFFLLIGTAFNCKTLSTPKADVSIQSAIYEGMALTDALYISISQSNDKSYSPFVSKYKQVDSIIDAILAKDKVRLHGEDLVKMDENIQNLFAKYEEEHSAAESISSSTAIIYSEYMKAVWKPRYNAEMRLK